MEEGQLEELGAEELTRFVEEGFFTRVDSHEEHLTLHPFYLQTPKQGVLQELRKTLGKYNPKLEAYVVGFQNVSCHSGSAALNEDHKWLHLDVLLTCYLYTPKVDQRLKGIIKKKATHAVICILFNVFTATVFPTDQYELDSWTLGDEVHFQITSFQNRRKGPVIRARSCNSQLSFDDDSIDKTKKRKKKKKEKLFEDSWE